MGGNAIHGSLVGGERGEIVISRLGTGVGNRRWEVGIGKRKRGSGGVDMAVAQQMREWKKVLGNAMDAHEAVHAIETIAGRTRRPIETLTWMWMKAYAEKGVEKRWDENVMGRQMAVVGATLGVGRVRMAEAWMTEVGRRHRKLKKERTLAEMERVARRFGIGWEGMEQVRREHAQLGAGMRSRQHEAVDGLYMALAMRMKGEAMPTPQSSTSGSASASTSGSGSGSGSASTSAPASGSGSAPASSRQAEAVARKEAQKETRVRNAARVLGVVSGANLPYQEEELEVIRQFCAENAVEVYLTRMGQRVERRETGEMERVLGMVVEVNGGGMQEGGWSMDMGASAGERALDAEAWHTLPDVFYFEGGIRHTVPMHKRTKRWQEVDLTVRRWMRRRGEDKKKAEFCGIVAKVDMVELASGRMDGLSTAHPESDMEMLKAVLEENPYRTVPIVAANPTAVPRLDCPEELRLPRRQLADPWDPAETEPRLTRRLEHAAQSINAGNELDTELALLEEVKAANLEREMVQDCAEACRVRVGDVPDTVHNLYTRIAEEMERERREAVLARTIGLRNVDWFLHMPRARTLALRDATLQVMERILHDGNGHDIGRFRAPTQYSMDHPHIIVHAEVRRFQGGASGRNTGRILKVHVRDEACDDMVLHFEVCVDSDQHPPDQPVIPAVLFFRAGEPERVDAGDASMPPAARCAAFARSLQRLGCLPRHKLLCSRRFFLCAFTHLNLPALVRGDLDDLLPHQDR